MTWDLIESDKVIAFGNNRGGTAKELSSPKQQSCFEGFFV